MNEIVKKVEALVKEASSQGGWENTKPLVEPVLDLIKREETMEGLSIVRRNGETSVFQTGNGKGVVFGQIAGKSALSFGGDGVGTLILAFMMVSMENQLPPPDVIRMLVELVEYAPRMDKSFKEIKA